MSEIPEIVALRRDRVFEPYPEATHLVRLDDAEDAVRRVAAAATAAERERWEAKQRPRITHGRHCTCTPCAREDWTNPALAPCGMHGRDCPQEYAPLGAAGDPVPADLIEKGNTDA